MADFFFFLQCVGIMIDLIFLHYSRYNEIVSRVRIRIRGHPLFVFIYYFCCFDKLGPYFVKSLQNAAITRMVGNVGNCVVNVATGNLVITRTEVVHLDVMLVRMV